MANGCWIYVCMFARTILVHTVETHCAHKYTFASTFILYIRYYTSIRCTHVFFFLVCLFAEVSAKNRVFSCALSSAAVAFFFLSSLSSVCLSIHLVGFVACAVVFVSCTIVCDFAVEAEEGEEEKYPSLNMSSLDIGEGDSSSNGNNSREAPNVTKVEETKSDINLVFLSR